MENAHLRFGQLEYFRNTGKNDTHVTVHADRYMGEGDQAHLLSIFGNDAEVGAVMAAIQEDHRFEIVFPDGTRQAAGFSKEAACFKGAINIPGHSRPLRHLVAVSSWLRGNGSAGRTFLLNYQEQTKDLAWSTLVSFLGLPADPRWGDLMLSGLERDQKITLLKGIGCAPAVINVTLGYMRKRRGWARKSGALPFPEKNGPILWPRFEMRQALLAA